MFKLVRDTDRCVQCGNCDILSRPTALPGYLTPRLMRESSSVLISPASLETHRGRIETAIERCHMEALSLEGVEG
ncbi:MAG: hypothetical protein OEV73_00525 [Desulfobulbaceae bacterium]|nr:hypothetical protein [Desulfobulbaceae bacterium]